MLGDGDFVEHVLLMAKERLHRKYVLASKGIGFKQLPQWVSELTAIPRSKWNGLPLTDLADRLRISLPTVSVAVQRGCEIVEREKLDIAQLRI
jgi:hypothetical protein